MSKIIKISEDQKKLIKVGHKKNIDSLLMSGQLNNILLAFKMAKVKSINLTYYWEAIGEIMKMDNYHYYGDFVTKTQMIDYVQSQSIHLTGNGLTSLPTSIKYFTNLHTLGLHGNSFTTIPKELLKLPNVKKIFLDSNNITEIPAWISMVKTLEVLSLSKNKINKDEIPEVVLNMDKLKLYL